jgi:oxygen-independent coproporphyrinogen-3 oxidase
MQRLGIPMPAQDARFGIYVHVPFCTSICTYCDFVKTGNFDSKDASIFFEQCLYQLRGIIAETEFPGRVCTLYFGGGTPGLFPAARFESLIAEVARHFVIEECTLETNPALTTPKRFAEFKTAGIDRVTIGAQSLCPHVLQVFGRRHAPHEALLSIEAARRAGFEQVQVDLIYGLKRGERTTRVTDEVSSFVGAGATGISAYALSLEKRTRLYGSELTSDDEAAKEYSELRSACISHGMKQNETSNFSFFEAKHNNIYWYGWPYVGVGTGAHGLLPPTPDHPWGRRYSVGNLLNEISPGNDFLPFKKFGNELFRMKWESERTRDDYFSELIFTLLRTPQGIPFGWLRDFCGTHVENTWRLDAQIGRAVLEGRLLLNDERIALMNDEFLLGDAWALHLISIANLNSDGHSKPDRCFP